MIGWFKRYARRVPVVLQIDDSAAMLEDGKRILEELGLRSLQAQGGAEGLRLAERERPDLILLDIVMPDMDGYKTLHALRKNPKTKAIPVLMLTGVDSMKDVEWALSVGADGYVPKPLQAERLKAKLSQWIK